MSHWVNAKSAHAASITKGAKRRQAAPLSSPNKHIESDFVAEVAMLNGVVERLNSNRWRACALLNHSYGRNRSNWWRLDDDGPAKSRNTSVVLRAAGPGCVILELDCVCQSISLSTVAASTIWLSRFHEIRSQILMLQTSSKPLPWENLKNRIVIDETLLPRTSNLQT